MSNELTALREQVVDHLKAQGFSAFPVMPEQAPIPCVWVAPDDPYITREGASFNSMIAHFQVNFAAEPATNEVAADSLDSMILDVMAALDELDDFVTGDVDKVGLVPINGQQYLAASIAVLTEFQRS